VIFEWSRYIKLQFILKYNTDAHEFYNEYLLLFVSIYTTTLPSVRSITWLHSFFFKSVVSRRLTISNIELMLENYLTYMLIRTYRSMHIAFIFATSALSLYVHELLFFFLIFLVYIKYCTKSILSWSRSQWFYSNVIFRLLNNLKFSKTPLNRFKLNTDDILATTFLEIKPRLKIHWAPEGRNTRYFVGLVT